MIVDRSWLKPEGTQDEWQYPPPGLGQRELGRTNWRGFPVRNRKIASLKAFGSVCSIVVLLVGVDGTTNGSERRGKKTDLGRSQSHRWVLKLLGEKIFDNRLPIPRQSCTIGINRSWGIHCTSVR